VLLSYIRLQRQKAVLQQMALEDSVDLRRRMPQKKAAVLVSTSSKLLGDEPIFRQEVFNCTTQLTYTDDVKKEIPSQSYWDDFS